MLKDPCSNQKCEFFHLCRFRPASPDDRPVPAIGLRVPARQTRTPLQFLLRVEAGIGWMGVLHVAGRVENDIKDALDEVEADLPTLAGLLVVYDSPGGAFRAGDYLERITLLAKQTMPVVAFVKSACSTCIIPSLAADATFGAPDCITGCFGNMRVFCDGKKPHPLINAQSPKKFEGGTPWPPDAFGDDKERQRLQELADLCAAKDLAIISGYSLKPLGHLRPFLDGRVLEAEESLEAGLVQKLCSEDEAYEFLLNAARKQKRK